MTLTAGSVAGQAWMVRERAAHFQMYRRQPVVLERGQGVRVWDVDGKEYIDFLAGIAVNALGHAHPAVLGALNDQASKLVHVSNLYYSSPQVELAELLVESSPFDRAFFCNSGAEANEGAIKLARKWGKQQRDGAYAVITAEHGFHGRTIATVTATGKEAYTRPFTPLPEGFPHVPYNDMDALERAIDASTAAVLLEPIQGEGGVHPAEQAYLRDVQDLCRAKNLLFMLDEVQTGIGRLGSLFGFERWGVEPDIVALAKGLGGGFPIGAVLAKEHAAVFEPGDHGSTFGGNPLACAVAAAVVRFILEHDVLASVQRVGESLRTRLRAIPHVTEVRGDGLLIGVELDGELAGDVVRLGLEEGLIVNNTGPTTLRLAPPLIISEAEAEEGAQRLARAIERAAA